MSREAWVRVPLPLPQTFELTETATPSRPVRAWYGHDVVNSAGIQQHHKC